MNDVFSPRRFRLTLVKTILERPVQLVGAAVLSLSGAFLVYFIFKTLANIGVAQLFSFVAGLVGGGCLLASMVFGYFTDGARAASYLTLPASAFEKWLCAISIIVVYTIVFLLYFRGIDGLFVHHYYSTFNHDDPRYSTMHRAFFVLSFSNEDAGGVLVFFLNAVGAMLVGSLYFNRVAFIKVALFICGLYFAILLLDYFLATLFFRNVANSFPFHHVSIRNGDENGQVVMPERFYPYYEAFSFYVLPAIFLIISYVRLKEKEA